MKTLKKVVVAVLALALTVGMTVSTMAGSTWGSYFGREEGAGHAVWFEGAKGTLKSQSDTGWVAVMDEIGWGGVWGGQVFQNESTGNGKVGVKKGTQYTLKCTLKSSGCAKWVFIKIATKEDYAYAKWVRVGKGGTVNVNETFEAKANANSIYFGIGGEFGDREDEKAPYSWASGGQSAIAANKGDVDALYSTTITCSGYSLTEASSGNGGGSGSGSTTNNNASSGSTTVATGDFEPFAFGAIAVLAAAAVVVFSKRKEA